MLLKISLAALDVLLFASEASIILAGLLVETEADAFTSLNSEITPIDARDRAIKKDSNND